MGMPVMDKERNGNENESRKEDMRWRAARTMVLNRKVDHERLAKEPPFL